MTKSVADYQVLFDGGFTLDAGSATREKDLTFTMPTGFKIENTILANRSSRFMPPRCRTRTSRCGSTRATSCRGIQYGPGARDVGPVQRVDAVPGGRIHSRRRAGKVHHHAGQGGVRPGGDVVSGRRRGLNAGSVHHSPNGMQRAQSGPRTETPPQPRGREDQGNRSGHAAHMMRGVNDFRRSVRETSGSSEEPRQASRDAASARRRIWFRSGRAGNTWPLPQFQRLRGSSPRRAAAASGR